MSILHRFLIFATACLLAAFEAPANAATVIADGELEVSSANLSELAEGQERLRRTADESPTSGLFGGGLSGNTVVSGIGFYGSASAVLTISGVEHFQSCLGRLLAETKPWLPDPALDGILRPPRA